MKMNKNLSKILLGVAVLLLILGGYMYRQGAITVAGVSVNVQTGVLSEAKAIEVITDYINNDLLEGQATAEITDLKRANGIYEFKVNIDGQEVDSYMTTNGAMLFPQGYEVTVKEEATTTEKVDTTSSITPSETPTAYLFTMTFCPYGNQAEDGIIPVVDLLGDSIEIEPHYVIYQDYRGGGPEYCLDDENQYCSMHGIQELNQDVRELCVYRDQKDKYWDFVDAINKTCTYNDVDTCWEGVAATTGVNATSVKTCEQNDALSLLATEVELNEKYDISGSPALVINDSLYSGGRAPEDYKTGICSAFINAPEACSTTLGAASASTGDASCE